MNFMNLEKMCPILTKIEKLRKRQKYIMNKYIKPETNYLEDFYSMVRMKSYCESWIFIEEQIQLLIEVKAQMKDDK